MLAFGIAGLSCGTELACTSGAPSFLHEILVELFRQRPALGPAHLHACTGLRLEGAIAATGSIVHA